MSGKPMGLTAGNGKNTGRWTEDEDKRMEVALSKFGTCYKKIQAFVGTRTLPQVYAKAEKMEKEARKQKRMLKPSFNAQAPLKIVRKTSLEPVYQTQFSDLTLKQEKIILDSPKKIGSTYTSDA